MSDAPTPARPPTGGLGRTLSLVFLALALVPALVSGFVLYQRASVTLEQSSLRQVEFLADLKRIVACAVDTVQQAGLKPEEVDALYFTGGSTGLGLLTDQLEAAFPQAKAVRGDRLASVATGLGLHARRLFTA